MEDHKAQINALAFAPDGLTLASCSHDGAVRLSHHRADPTDAGSVMIPCLDRIFRADS